MEKIKFVYFDIGGVMIKDFSATKNWDEMTTKWEMFGERKKDIDAFFYNIEKEVCKGRDIDDFLPILKNVFEIKVPKNYSILKDFVDRFEKNEGIWKIAKDCQKRGGVGLLTAMYPRMFSSIKDRGLLPEIDFVMVDSSIEKCSKPDKKIYEIAQERVKVKPEEILFIDNKEKNLVVPKEMGWKTFLFDSRDYEKSNKELGIFLANKVEF